MSKTKATPPFKIGDKVRVADKIDEAKYRKNAIGFVDDMRECYGQVYKIQDIRRCGSNYHIELEGTYFTFYASDLTLVQEEMKEDAKIEPSEHKVWYAVSMNSIDTGLMTEEQLLEFILNEFGRTYFNNGYTNGPIVTKIEIGVPPVQLKVSGICQSVKLSSI